MPPAIQQAAFSHDAIQSVTFCGGCGMAPGSCGCGDGFTYTSPCTGACGGVCGGGCGGGGGGGRHRGVLRHILGGSAGLAGGAATGVGSLLGMNGAWLDVEYLLWWNKDRYIPALATQSPTGTPIANAGVLGAPSTSILFGDESINGSPNSGFRISSGMWLEPTQSTGIGFRYFTIEDEENFNVSSDGDPILGRPFFDTVTGSGAALLVAFPGVNSGSIDVTATNEARGFDVYFRKLLLSGNCNRFDLIGGYHNSTVEDTVNIRNSITGIDGTRIPIDATITTQDNFVVENQFHGGFVGLLAEAGDGALSWSMMGKIAFGNMNQEARISGSTTSSVPGAGSATSPQGLLALPSNIGSFDQDEFALVPEFNVSVRYNLNSRMQFILGYSFIYWSEVALAGDTIDLNVNSSQFTGPLVGAAQPAVSLKSDGFWYTGLSVGGSLRF